MRIRNRGSDELGLSQYQIAEILGISRTRVAQIEKSAMNKMKELVKPEFKYLLEYDTNS